MPPPVVSFVPGPAHVRQEVLDALGAPPLPHRSAAFGEIVARVQSRLASVLHTAQPVIPVLGSGTTSLEVALRAVARERVLALSGGAFADRSAAIAGALGLAVEKLTVPPGFAVAPDAVERALASAPFDTVTVVHSETSTGALTDLAGVAAVVADRPGTALVIDAVSSFGGVDLHFDSLGPAAVLVGVTGKCLACPPGMSVVAVGLEAAERARSSTRGGYALDLVRLLESHAKGVTPHTPNTPLFYALDRQLGRIADEGMTARAARHERLAALVSDWAEERFAVLAPEGGRSPTVTAVENTRGLDVAALLPEVERRGFRIADGYGALRGATFRIGHMGDVTEEETRALLAALDESIAAAD